MSSLSFKYLVTKPCSVIKGLQTKIWKWYTDHRHHVELHGHGDDVEPDHGGDGQVKVFRRYNLQERTNIVENLASSAARKEILCI